MNERERLGSLIRDIRQQKGMTQEQLAEECGMKRATIIKIELGKFNASVDILSAILRPLGYKLDIKGA